MKFVLKKEELEAQLWKHLGSMPMKDVISFTKNLPDEIELEGKVIIDSMKYENT